MFSSLLALSDLGTPKEIVSPSSLVAGSHYSPTSLSSLDSEVRYKSSVPLAASSGLFLSPFFLKTNTFESYAFRLYHLVAVICQLPGYSLTILQDFSSWLTFYETTPIITHDEFLSM